MKLDEHRRQRFREAIADLRGKVDELYRDAPRHTKERHLHELLRIFLNRGIATLAAEGVIEGTAIEREKAKAVMLEVVQEEFGDLIHPEWL